MSLALYAFRNMIYTNCRRLNVKNHVELFSKCDDFKLNTALTSHTLKISRCLSTQPNPTSKPAYTPLMEFPEATWPGFFQMIKCWLTLKVGLPSLDKDFDLIEFIDGSQQAIYVVSNALSREDYESLDGLVTPAALELLKKNISRLSEEERKEIALQKKEFFFCFPWAVNMRPETAQTTKTVEVTMVYHLLRNWRDSEITSKVYESNSGMQRLDVMHKTVSSPEYPSHAIVCNYRFVRDFDNTEKSWAIDIVNQFRLCDVTQ